MKNILFYLYPTISHYNACMGMADYFREKGYRITFCGPPAAENYVKGKGYLFEPFSYYIKPYFKNLKEGFRYFLQSRLDKTLVKKRYKAYLLHIRNLENLYAAIDPDYIFIDAHLSPDYLFLKGKPAQVFIVHTKLSTMKFPAILPLYSEEITGNNLFSRLKAEYEWATYFFKRNLKNKLVNLALLNKGDTYFSARQARQQGISLPAVFDKNNVFFDGVRQVKTILLSPRQLDYPWKPKHPDEVHASFPRYGRDNDKWQEFYRILEPAVRAKEEPGSKQKIVYCSLGTISGIRTQDAITFLKNVIAVFSNMPDAFLIISAGDLTEAVSGPTPDNIKILKIVPQLRLLDYCDLMITHGGLNSIKECITAGVPMLVYPLNKKWDQPGNAARIVYHKMGLKGDVEKASANDIEQKVKQLLKDNTFKQNTLKMQQHLVGPDAGFDLEAALGMKNTVESFSSGQPRLV